MIDLLLPTSIAIGLLTWTLIAKWYLLPWTRSQSLEAALTPLLLLNALRYVGLAFLIPGVTAEPLDPRFAAPAAWGDLAAAVLALVALLALRQRWSSAGMLVWTFSIFGALDLLNAVAQGLRYTVDGHLGATYFIPAIFVPMLLVAHVVIALVQIRHGSLAHRQAVADAPHLPPRSSHPAVSALNRRPPGPSPGGASARHQGSSID